MPKIFAALYMLLMAAAGWRLFAMDWSRNRKIAAAVALIVPFPMLFLVPALVNPARPFADLLCAVGLALMAGGTTSLLGGMVGAWLRARRA